MNNNIKQLAIKALTLYKENFELETTESIESHTKLKCGVGAYFSDGGVSGYAEIKMCGIEFNQKTQSLKIEYTDEIFPVDIEKWLNAVIATLKVNKNQEYKQQDFKIDVKPIIPTDRTIDKAITKAEILDQLLNKNVSFNN